MTVKMWVIGGVYKKLDGTEIRLDEMSRPASKLIAVFSYHKRADRQFLCTNFTGISGPTHVPCPICALMQQVSTDCLQIDLAEHLMRHHPSEWKKQQEETPSSVDAGEGWRLLESNETVQPGDQFKTRVSEHWRVCDFSIGQLVEDCEDYVFRRRIEPTAEDYMTPDCSVDPGAGYRILGKQELLRPGDDYWSVSELKWICSFRVREKKSQHPNVQYRRKLTYPGIEADRFRFVDESEARKDSDEIWSFVDEQWKSIEHMWCNEFKGLPVVRRRRIEQERHENKSEVKSADRKTRQNCVFFTFSGESFAILLTPNGKVSLHRCVPFAGLSMIVERSSFEELVEGRRNCLLEVLLKSGIRLPAANEITGVKDERFSERFIESAQAAWGQS